MGKKKAESKQAAAAEQPSRELVELVVIRPADPDLAILTWKDLDGQVQTDQVRASVLRGKIKTIGSRKMPDQASQERMVAQVDLWKWQLSCFGKAGQAKPHEEPIQRNDLSAPRARSVEELTP